VGTPEDSSSEAARAASAADAATMTAPQAQATTIGRERNRCKEDMGGDFGDPTRTPRKMVVC
jgi:hypothetical protein